MRLRKLWFRLHLLLGILLGIYASGIGLTGSVLVYRPELVRALRPELFEPVATIRTTPDEALATVKQAYPADRVLTLTGPGPETGAWMAYLQGKGGAMEVYVDAGTGRLRGHYQRRESWLGSLESLHYNLWSGRTGRWVNGCCALAVVALALTGLLLWRPHFARSLRGARNLHANLGLLTAAFLILMGVTGGYFTWYQPYVNAVRAILPAPAKQPLPPILPVGKPQSLAALTGAARKVVPDAAPYRISLLSGPTEAMQISMRHGNLNEFQLVSHVALDPYTLRVLRLERLENRPEADRLIGNFSAVHFGVWGGAAARLLWAVLGLSLPVLFATSFALWWKKLRQKGPAELWR